MKIVALMVCSVLCLFMNGCSRNSATGSAVVNQEQLHFVYIAPCVDEDFFNPVKKGMRDAAALMHVECEFTGTEDVDIEEQISMVRDAVSRGCDGIALSIIDPVAFDAVVSETIKKGIPVVSFNVDDNSTPNARLSSVCQDLYRAGRSLGSNIRDDIPQGSKVLMTVHSAGISALEDRLRGMQDILKEKDITFKVVVTGTNSEKAAEVIASELKADASIHAVLATGLADTEGAGLAVERECHGKEYVVAGFDLSAEILRLVDKGVIRFTVDQQPYIQGFYPAVQLSLYCRYGIMPSNIDTGATLITKDNAKTVLELCGEKYR